MKTSTNRTVRSSFITAIFVGILFLITGSTTVMAQQNSNQEKSLKEHLKKKQQELREKAGIEEDQQQAPLQQSGVDLGSLAGPYAVFEKDQSWMFGNAGGSFKTPPNRSGQWAGDISGDDIPDYIMRSNPDGPETVVYFGGNTGTQPDQILNEQLSPIGDINNDGNTDAVNPSGDIFLGSSNGYQSSGNSLTSTIGDNDIGMDTQIIPAGDIDGDGIDDLILFRQSEYSDVIVYWGNSNGEFGQHFLDLELHYSDFDRNVNQFTLNTGDFNGDGTNEIYSFIRDWNTGNYFIRIHNVGSDQGTLTLEQEFQYSEGLQASVYDYAINVVDINGDGFNEIFLRPQASYGEFANYVFVEDENNPDMYNSTGINVFTGMAWPVGDLNDDGNIDFHLGDPDSDNSPYLGYGPDNITEGSLTLDTHLPLSSSDEWRYYYNTEYSFKELGDINDDGIDDYVLGLLDRSNDEIGRVFVYGNDSGNPTTDNALANRLDFLDYFNGISNVGDVNGDGIDDFAINRITNETVEIFFGGSPINDQPDVTLNANYTFSTESGGTVETSALGIIGGDFDGDGINDIAISDNYGVYVHIHLGGDNINSEADHTIVGSDFSRATGNSVFYKIKNIGDVNDDGIDDFLLGSLLASNDSGDLNEAYLFFGDSSSLPNSPDATLQLADVGPLTYSGWEATSVGDMNGDGIDDFAVSSPFYNNQGKVDVFYGNSSGDFTSPDITLSPSGNDDTNGFGYSLAGGDFNGDGAGDVAVGKQIVYPASTSDEEVSNIDVFLGGENVDDEVDHHLKIDSESVGISGNYLQSYTGRLSTIDDHDGNGTDEIIAFSPGAVNAVVFSGDLNMTEEQTLVLKSHNASASLGNAYNNAVGDFTGNGNPDVIAQQSSRESSFIDVGHRYGLPDPVNIASVEDVPNDQGGWVRVQADGYYMDALDADIVGFDHWAVWRQNDDENWVNVGTVPAYGESADYVDVHVPNTKIEGSEADSTTYHFKITAQNTAENNLAVSDVDSGFALDNISPNAVDGITADRNDSEVVLSWNASEANDLNEYEIVSADNPDEPIATTFQNSITLSDSEFSGIQELSVRARDIHENAGDLSKEALAVFHTDLSYEVNSNWNLIGIPLDADQDEVSSLLSNVEGDKLYEFDGKYNKVDESDVEPGKGYWAKFSSDENYGVSGLPLVDLTLELDEGWNLISGVGASVNVDQIKDSDNILIDGTLRSFDGAYQEESAMQPAGGYWIRASESGSVTLSLTEDEAEQTQAKDSKPKLSEVKDELSKVMISSSADYESTLYFGDELPDHVDSRSFSMPPVAPGKTFDVRYASNGMNYVEGNDFTVDIEKQEQVNDVTVELDLNNNSKNGSFKVQEKKGTEVIAEYMLENETAVTLKNSDVTSVTFSSGNEDIAQQDMPEKFEMSPSYPNPFNPSTTIKYQIPEQVDVNVDVYNMAGKKVRTLVAGEQQEAGTHTIRFNASDLSSGIYFVQMRAGSFEHVQKITLIK